MARRVTVTKTARNPLTGTRRTVTHTYLKRERRRWGRGMLRFFGVRPWNRKRFLISLGVFFWLEMMSAGPQVGLGYTLVLALGLLAWKIGPELRPRKVAPPAGRRVVPGPAWCDHCADWTTHDSASHPVAGGRRSDGLEQGEL